MKDKKVYLENCYHCGANKEAVKHSQSIKDPIYCVLMGTATEDGHAEAYAEWDRHLFVVKQSAIDADLQAEADWFKANGYDDNGHSMLI